MTQDQAKRITLHAPAIDVRREYGLTEAEVYEIARTGSVSYATRVWADDLRARCPRAFQ